MQRLQYTLVVIRSQCEEAPEDSSGDKIFVCMLLTTVMVIRFQCAEAPEGHVGFVDTVEINCVRRLILANGDKNLHLYQRHVITAIASQCTV